MQLADHSLALLGAVLLVGLLIPTFLERFRVPFVSALVLVGSLLGPHGFDLLRPDATLTVFAFMGATFQMLLAGFEARGLDLRLIDRKNTIIFACNGLLPALVGGGLGWYLGYSWHGALLTAAIFMSSSVVLVFSFVRHFNLDVEEVGRRLEASAVLQDLGATLLAFFLLKNLTPHERFPLPILVGLVFSSVLALRMFVPEVVAFAFSRFHREGQAAIEQRVRFVLALMLLVLFMYSVLDVPPIVAAFLVGFSLASIDHSEVLSDRLHLIGYALFIPVFYISVGLETDLHSLFTVAPSNFIVAVLVLTAIASKVFGGFTGGVLAGFERREAWILGLGSSVKLAVPITATYAALKRGIIGPDLFTAVVVVSVLTALLLPFGLEIVLQKRARRG